MEGGTVRHNFEKGPSKFGSKCFSGFRGQDLNMKAYDIRQWMATNRSKNRISKHYVKPPLAWAELFFFQSIINHYVHWQPYWMLDKERRTFFHNGKYSNGPWPVELKNEISRFFSNKKKK